MSVRNLDALFHPSSIAVIGASNRPGSVGSVVMKNLLQGGFEGAVMPVNPHHDSISGVLAYPDIASLPVTADLAIICTPAPTVRGIITELGKRKTRSAIILTAGIPMEAKGNKPSQTALLKASKPHMLRMLGPNTIGLLVPEIGLNASFAHTDIPPGRLAFAGQSGGLATAILDLAHSRGIGFSNFVSLGNMADIDFGDTLDYLCSDPHTDAILLYIESITNPRKFMSAARAAAKNKMVLAIKAGRVAEGARAAASHTGALAGSDDVFDAALRRAGVLRVNEIDELFAAVETLGRSRPMRGDRLAILTNSGGPGVLATDALVTGGGRLAELSPDTLKKLDSQLSVLWSGSNPVDLAGDAPGERYADALRILLEDPNVDAVLVLNVPTAISPSEDAARAVARLARETRSNVLTSWLGSNSAEPSRRIFAEAGLPTYETPDKAVRAFLHMVHYRRNQEILMETPPSIPTDFTHGVDVAREVVAKVLGEERSVLTEPEAKQILMAYDIPTVETHVAKTPEEAARIAEEIGFPVALKILSHDISHKSDVGGVVLDLQSPEIVRLTATGMKTHIEAVSPEMSILGYTVQRMARMPNAHELIIGVTLDPIFGPIILFGQGGTAVEVIGDRAVDLPPLNMGLAKKLIFRTRISGLLSGFRNLPAADIDAICLTLIQISQLIVDVPEIAELDINPLFANDKGVLALDARIRVEPAKGTGPERLAIRPYPRELEEEAVLKTGRKVKLRPIRPEDEENHKILLDSCSPEDIRFRFFATRGEFRHSELVRFTQNDYDREMAFIATSPDEKGKFETLGVIRTITDDTNLRDEYAIIVRSDMKGKGLGRLLMEKMVRYCTNRGSREIWGLVLKNNEAMLGLVKNLGFKAGPSSETNAYKVTLKPHQK